MTRHATHSPDTDTGTRHNIRHSSPKISQNTFDRKIVEAAAGSLSSGTPPQDPTLQALRLYPPILVGVDRQTITHANQDTHSAYVHTWYTTIHTKKVLTYIAHFYGLRCSRGNTRYVLYVLKTTKAWAREGKETVNEGGDTTGDEAAECMAHCVRFKRRRDEWEEGRKQSVSTLTPPTRYIFSV